MAELSLGQSWNPNWSRNARRWRRRVTEGSGGGGFSFRAPASHARAAGSKCMIRRGRTFEATTSIRTTPAAEFHPSCLVARYPVSCRREVTVNRCRRSNPRLVAALARRWRLKIFGNCLTTAAEDCSKSRRLAKTAFGRLNSENALESHGFHRENRRHLAPETGLEPVTRRLTAGCSTIELLWKPEGRTASHGPPRPSNSISPRQRTRPHPGFPPVWP